MVNTQQGSPLINGPFGVFGVFGVVSSDCRCTFTKSAVTTDYYIKL